MPYISSRQYYGKNFVHVCMYVCMCVCMCVCICMYLCVCMCVHMCVHICVCGGGKLKNNLRCHASGAIYLFCDRVSQWCGVTYSARLAGHWAPCICLPIIWISNAHHHTQTFYEKCENWTQIFLFHSKEFANWPIFQLSCHLYNVWSAVYPFYMK